MASTLIEIVKNGNDLFRVIEAGMRRYDDLTTNEAFAMTFKLIAANYEDGERVRLTHPGAEKFKLLDQIIAALV